MAFADEITVEALETDPYPIYAQLRREAPVAWVPAANVWFVTRWQDVEFVSKNAKLFAAEVPTSPVDRTMGSPTILTCDGPAHGELRRGFDTKYKPRAVAEYIDGLAKPIVAAHLDRIASRGSAELMSEYFEPASSVATARGLYLVSKPRRSSPWAGPSQVKIVGEPMVRSTGEVGTSAANSLAFLLTNSTSCQRVTNQTFAAGTQATGASRRSCA